MVKNAAKSKKPPAKRMSKRTIKKDDFDTIQINAEVDNLQGRSKEEIQLLVNKI